MCIRGLPGAVLDSAAGKSRIGTGGCNHDVIETCAKKPRLRMVKTQSKGSARN